MANKIVLVRMFIEFDRMGELDGMFVCDQELLERLYDRDAHFGEVLGKHSEVIATLNADMFEVKSEDAEFIKQLVDILGVDINGFNPFDHIRNEYGEMEYQLSTESWAFLRGHIEAQDVL